MNIYAKLSFVSATFVALAAPADASLVAVVSVERSYSGSANAVPLSGPTVSSTLDEMASGLGSLPQVLRAANSGDGTNMIARGESASASLLSSSHSAEIVLEAISGASKSSTLTLVPAGNNSRAEARVAFNSMLDFSLNPEPTSLLFRADRFVFGNNTSGTLRIHEQGGSDLFNSDVSSLPAEWQITASPNSTVLLDIELLSSSFNDFFRPGSVDFDNQRLTLNVTAVPEPNFGLVIVATSIFPFMLRNRKRQA